MNAGLAAPSAQYNATGSCFTTEAVAIAMLPDWRLSCTPAIRSFLTSEIWGYLFGRIEGAEKGLSYMPLTKAIAEFLGHFGLVFGGCGKVVLEQGGLTPARNNTAHILFLPVRA